AIVVREALARSGAAAACVDEVIMGNVLSAGLGQAPARQAALAAGLPPGVAAVTVNKMCGSGLKAVMLAAQAIRCGDADVVVAGGMESMSRAPHLLLGGRHGWKLGDQKVVDSILRDGLLDAYEDCHMGNQADYIARVGKVSREDQDRFAVESHQRATAAIRSGAFQDEIIPVDVPVRGGSVAVSADEGPRPDSTLERVAALAPVFEEGGTVTAANASQLSDGAAAVVVSSSRYAEANNLQPMARIVAYTTSGVDPQDVFIAPVSAIRKLLDQTQLSIRDIDLFELNEAFAAQMLACIKPLGLPQERVNVHGGAIALGHPIGASGARVLVTLVHALQQRQVRRGVAALCLGGGNAVAMMVEREG
ncbi:MAG: acetyl-CoA C-acyltransferase, partial [Lentisphaerae bacterium]|nr:acetyl-CoA C-acyltransferase [Lentisphaerota bacterium]